MSNHLNFYLIPKNKERLTLDSKSLLFTSYTKATDTYQIINKYFNIENIEKDKGIQYIELTSNIIDTIEKSIKTSIDTVTKSLELKINAYKEFADLSKEDLLSFMEDYLSTEKSIETLRIDLKVVQFLSDIVENLKYSDFEKILITVEQL